MFNTSLLENSSMESSHTCAQRNCDDAIPMYPLTEDNSLPSPKQTTTMSADSVKT